MGRKAWDNRRGNRKPSFQILEDAVALAAESDRIRSARKSQRCCLLREDALQPRCCKVQESPYLDRQKPVGGVDEIHRH